MTTGRRQEERQRRDEPHCTDCRLDLHRSGEYAFMLVPIVWKLACSTDTELHPKRDATSHEVLLCVGCMQERLGRTLRPQDFDRSVPLTHMKGRHRSRRLRDAIGPISDTERHRLSTTHYQAIRKPT